VFWIVCSDEREASNNKHSRTLPDCTGAWAKINAGGVQQALSVGASHYEGRGLENKSTEAVWRTVPC
jgi:hypothetical protein